MTYFFFYVILNDSEGSHRRSDRHILLTLVMGYFACAQYDVKAQAGYFACAQYDVLDLGDCRGTSCLAMTTIRTIVPWDISLALNMTYFYYLSVFLNFNA